MNMQSNTRCDCCSGLSSPTAWNRVDATSRSIFDLLQTNTPVLGAACTSRCQPTGANCTHHVYSGLPCASTMSRPWTTLSDVLQGAPTQGTFSTVSPAPHAPADMLPASTQLPPEARLAKPSHTSMASGFERQSRTSVEASLALAHAERLGSATTGSWKVRDIHWGFVFRAQHYGTLFFTMFIVIALACLHWRGRPRNRGYFLYDPSISYQSAGDTVPSAVAILIPFASLIISLCAYEFWVYKLENWHITNAVATVVHFLLDCLCAFVTVETFSEATKIAAGRLRPDFFQQCKPDVNWTSGPVQLGEQLTSQCTADYSDGRRSFVSSHASTSSVLIGYNIVYLIWAGVAVCLHAVLCSSQLPLSTHAHLLIMASRLCLL